MTRRGKKRGKRSPGNASISRFFAGKKQVTFAPSPPGKQRGGSAKKGKSPRQQVEGAVDTAADPTLDETQNDRQSEDMEVDDQDTQSRDIGDDSSQEEDDSDEIIDDIDNILARDDKVSATRPDNYIADLPKFRKPAATPGQATSDSSAEENAENETDSPQTQGQEEDEDMADGEADDEEMLESDQEEDGNREQDEEVSDEEGSEYEEEVVSPAAVVNAFGPTNFTLAGRPVDEGNVSRGTRDEHDGEALATIQRTKPKESKANNKRRRATEAANPQNLEWKDGHYFRLVPQPWSIMLAPRMGRKIPATSPTLEPAPPTYRRPVVNRHVGYLTASQPERAPQTLKSMGGLTMRQTTRGNPVYAKPAANSGGTLLVNRTGQNVSEDHVFLNKELKKKGALQRLLAQMCTEFDKADEAERADLVRRYTAWRVRRRIDELETIRQIREEELWHLFNPDHLDTIQDDDAFEGLRMWVDIENRREELGDFPVEYSGEPAAEVEIDDASKATLAKISGWAGIKVTGSDFFTLKQVARVVVENQRLYDVQLWKKNGRKGKQPHKLRNTGQPAKDFWLRFYSDQEKERLANQYVTEWSAKLGKKPPGRPSKKGESKATEAPPSDSDDMVDETSRRPRDWRRLIDEMSGRAPPSAAAKKRRALRASTVAQRPPPVHANLQISRAVFESLYPNGYLLVATPSEGLLCALNAVVISITELNRAFPNYNVPVPSVGDLQDELDRPEHHQALQDGELAHVNNNYHVDMVALALKSWAARVHGHDLCLGYLGPEIDPTLIDYQDGDAVIFIHNDEAGDGDDSLSHFEGLRPAPPAVSQKKGKAATKVATPKTKPTSKQASTGSKSKGKPSTPNSKSTGSPSTPTSRSTTRGTGTPLKSAMKNSASKATPILDGNKKGGVTKVYPTLPRLMDKEKSTRRFTFMPATMVKYKEDDELRPPTTGGSRYYISPIPYKNPMALKEDGSRVALHDVHVIALDYAEPAEQDVWHSRVSFEFQMSIGSIYDRAGYRHHAFGYQILDGNEESTRGRQSARTSSAADRTDAVVARDISRSRSRPASTARPEKKTTKDAATAAAKDHLETLRDEVGQWNEKKAANLRRATKRYVDENKLVTPSKFRQSGKELLIAFPVYWQKSQAQGETLILWIKVPVDSEGGYLRKDVDQEMRNGNWRGASGGRSMHWGRKWTGSFGPCEPANWAQWRTTEELGDYDEINKRFYEAKVAYAKLLDQKVDAPAPAPTNVVKPAPAKHDMGSPPPGESPAKKQKRGSTTKSPKGQDAATPDVGAFRKQMLSMTDEQMSRFMTAMTVDHGASKLDFNKPTRDGTPDGTDDEEGLDSPSPDSPSPSPSKIPSKSRRYRL